MKTKIGAFLFIIIVLAIFIAAIVWISQTSSYKPEDMKTQIIRVTYEEDGVVCWVLMGYGGISCLPLSETNIGK